MKPVIKILNESETLMHVDETLYEFKIRTTDYKNNHVCTCCDLYFCSSNRHPKQTRSSFHCTECYCMGSYRKDSTGGYWVFFENSKKSKPLPIPSEEELAILSIML